ncbi:glycerate kinase [Nocardia stercoris]|uniref:Glycerate kinase n=1 Tax=Nocardia stercoris TaxID=2483361 RepID=A0A3M2L9Z7_9NOCA|nr:glycerate kinase [Nocardia stercoris]RMI34397.1 glycerate kinase [Nocardia stercoris]
MGARLRVVVAPDKFKGSLTAPAVAAALAAGIGSAAPDVEVLQLPVADGGDGTVDAFVAAGWERRTVRVEGPTGVLSEASYAASGDRAVVELADVVGLAKLPGGVRDPLGASTYGLGQVISAALTRSPRSLVLGLGGSASTDGGAGMLQALGADVFDANGSQLGRGGAALAEATRYFGERVHAAVRGCAVTLATDVDNPLLGPDGAAAVFGPQKGATPEQVSELEAALANWSVLLNPELATHPGAGAAGGTGFAALAELGATQRRGIDLVLELLDFPARVTGADLVVTGEGALDEQTLQGKAPLGVCAAARAAGVPVVAVAGRNALSAEQLHRAGFEQCYELAALEPDPVRSMVAAAELLRQVGARIAGDRLRGQ